MQCGFQFSISTVVLRLNENLEKFVIQLCITILRKFKYSLQHFLTVNADRLDELII